MIALTLCRIVETTGAVVLGGAASFRLLARGVPASRADRRLAWGGAAAVVAAGGLRLWLTAAEMSGQTPAAAWSVELWRETLTGTRFGHGRIVQIVALGFVVGVMAMRRWRASPAGKWAAGGLAAVALASPQWSGHAAASGHGASLLTANALHVLAAGVWPGGLPFLAVMLARVGGERDLLPTALAATRRFSGASVAAVSILALTGLLNAWGLVGTFAALTGAFYGRMLLLKVTVFGGMVALGAVNRRLVGRLKPNAGNHSAVLPVLWRNVAVECGLAGLVLIATELLAMSAPPGGR